MAEARRTAIKDLEAKPFLAPAPADASSVLVKEEEKNTINGNGGKSDADNSDEDDGDIIAQERRYMTLPQLFWLYLQFGVRLWGGPMAQIDMLRTHFVDTEKWITRARFNRVCAVYQVLPGPEATELAIYFGMLSRGRLGALLGGIGFLLPGFCIVLLFSYLYTEFGITLPPVKAAFMAVQPAVAAMIIRGVQRLAESSLQDPDSKQFSILMLGIAMFSSIQFVLNIPFFILLPINGLLYAFVNRAAQAWGNKGPRCAFSRESPLLWILLSLMWFLLMVGSFTVYVVLHKGLPPPFSIGGGSLFGGHSILGLFILGLISGMLSFGGAYAAIPFVQQEAVTMGKWLLQQQFIDGLAIVQIVPTPLVMFCTFVGYIGGGFGGAFIMTLGMFLPAFSFPIVGHHFFEKLVEFRPSRMVLDGVTAAVMGLIGPTTVMLVKNLVTNPMEVVILVLSLASLYSFKSPWTSPFIVICAAVAGQILFIGT